MAKLKSILSAALLTAALLASATASELKVGYVNSQRVVRDAPAAIKAGKKLEQEFGKRDQELRRLAADLQSRQEALEKDGITLAESDRRAKEREVNELSRDFQRKQREIQEDLNLRQNEENSALVEKANLVIKQIAEAEKFDLILQDAVWVGPGLDITDKVIKALGDGR